MCPIQFRVVEEGIGKMDHNIQAKKMGFYDEDPIMAWNNVKEFPGNYW